MRPCCKLSGKRRYATYTKAVRAAIGSSKSYGKPLRIYRCPDCGDYHLTSKVRG